MQNMCFIFAQYSELSGKGTFQVWRTAVFLWILNNSRHYGSQLSLIFQFTALDIIVCSLTLLFYSCSGETRDFYSSLEDTFKDVWLSSACTVETNTAPHSGVGFVPKGRFVLSGQVDLWRQRVLHDFIWKLSQMFFLSNNTACCSRSPSVLSLITKMHSY